MGILIFSARIHSLMAQKSAIQYKLAKITKRIQDLQQYSALIGDRNVSIGRMLSAPGSMMSRTMAYFAYAHNSSMQYMQQNAPYFIQMYNQQMAGQPQNPQQAQMMQNYIMRSLYEQGRDRAAQIEEKNLHAEEGRLNQEKEKQQALLDEVAQELKSAKEARDKDIELFAPKYTA